MVERDLNYWFHDEAKLFGDGRESCFEGGLNCSSYADTFISVAEVYIFGGLELI